MNWHHNAHAEDHSAGHEQQTAGTRQRRYRAWPRWAGGLAVTAGIVMLAAACSSPSSSSSSSGSSRLQQDFSFTQCMRSNGLPGFPDPNANGQGFGNQQQQHQERSDLHFSTALTTCQHLLPAASAQPKTAPGNASLERFAQCMRTHGVRNYPDPNPNVSVATQLAQAGINPNSPSFQNTLSTCDRLAPVQVGGS